MSCTPRPNRVEASELRRALSDPHRVVAALGLGTGAQRQAAGLLIRCPWHDDNGPSCSVKRGRDGTLFARCHGCGHTGDVLHLVAAVHRLDVKRDFAAVLQAAAELAGGHVLASAQAYEPPPPPLAPDVYDAIATELLALCPLGRESRAYLSLRGIEQAAEIDGWGCLPLPSQQGPTVARLVARFDLEQLERAGLIWDGRTDHVRRSAHRLLIPWRNAQGRIACIQRRLLRPAHDEEPKYIFPTGHAPRALYGSDQVGTEGPVAFVEGAVDVLALRVLAVGLTRVVGLAGVSSWHPEQAELARGRPTFVALDADVAGDRAAVGLTRDLETHGSEPVKRWRPAAGAKDWAEMLATRVSAARTPMAR